MIAGRTCGPPARIPTPKPLERIQGCTPARTSGRDSIFPYTAKWSSNYDAPCSLAPLLLPCGYWSLMRRNSLPSAPSVPWVAPATTWWRRVRAGLAGLPRPGRVTARSCAPPPIPGAITWIFANGSPASLPAGNLTPSSPLPKGPSWLSRRCVPGSSAHQAPDSRRRNPGLQPE